MRNLGAAVSTFILVAVLGSQAGLTHGKFTEPSHPVGKSMGTAELEMRQRRDHCPLELLPILDMVMGVTASGYRPAFVCSL